MGVVLTMALSVLMFCSSAFALWMLVDSFQRPKAVAYNAVVWRILLCAALFFPLGLIVPILYFSRVKHGSMPTDVRSKRASA